MNEEVEKDEDTFPIVEIPEDMYEIDQVSDALQEIDRENKQAIGWPTI